MIQVLIGFLFIFLVLSFLFFVAWYIALPVLLIIVAFGIVGRVWDKIKSWATPEPPVEKLVRTETRKTSKKHQVIDVDYTEI